MEMVKVDVQKLQLLNDRIAQTIDALNQVRLSVHGIQHTGQQWSPYGAFGISPYGLQPSYGAPFQPGFVPPFSGFSPFTPYGAPGIQHTTGFAPYVTSPTGFARVSPYTASPYATTPYATTPYATTPYATAPYAGIQHTTPAPLTTVPGWPWSNGLSHSSWMQMPMPQMPSMS